MTKSFYIDTSEPKNNNTKPANYIFDQSYKSAMNKMKFQRNPKYSYFNAIVKMKNKLQKSQHSVFQQVFDYQNRDDGGEYYLQTAQDNRNKSGFQSYANKTWNSKRNIQLEQSLEKGSKQLKQENKNDKKYIKDISFQGVHNRHKRQFSQERPRLDNILAQLRKINRKQKGSTTNPGFNHSVSGSSTRKNNKMMMNQTCGNFTSTPNSAQMKKLNNQAHKYFVTKGSSFNIKRTRNKSNFV